LIEKIKHAFSTQFLLLDQGFPTWGTCTPKGTFAYPNGYI